MGATASGGVTLMRAFSSLIPSTCFISCYKLTHGGAWSVRKSFFRRASSPLAVRVCVSRQGRGDYRQRESERPSQGNQAKAVVAHMASRRRRLPYTYEASPVPYTSTRSSCKLNTYSLMMILFKNALLILPLYTYVSVPLLLVQLLVKPAPLTPTFDVGCAPASPVAWQ